MNIQPVFFVDTFLAFSQSVRTFCHFPCTLTQSYDSMMTNYCSDVRGKWDDNDAKVVCRMLGLDTAHAIPSNFHHPEICCKVIRYSY